MTVFARRFAGKAMVVTGAAQGIGRRVAERAWLERGAPAVHSGAGLKAGLAL